MGSKKKGPVRSPETDAVLARFADEHPRPLAQDVRNWTKSHPHLAKDLVVLSIDLNRIAALSDDSRSKEPSQADLNEGWLLHSETVRARLTEEGPRLAAIAAAASTDLANLADDLDIDRRILNGLEAGRINLPVSSRLVMAIATALRETVERVANALTTSYSTPMVAFAKAQGQPSTARITFTDAVRNSDMSDERQAFWLGED